MKEKNDYVRPETSIKNLYRGLEDILQETERIVNAACDQRDIRQIAQYLAQIRVLLTGLRGPEDRSGRDDAEGKMLTDLIARYLNVEGRIKEIRNDMESGENKQPKDR